MQFPFGAFQQKAMEESSDCIKVLDFEGHLLYMNSCGQKSIEVDDLSQCLYTEWATWWPLESQPIAREALAIAQAGGAGTFQGFCPTFKGTPKWWDVIVTPMLSDDGHTKYILSICRDITERKREDEALHFLAQTSSILASSLDYETTLKQLTPLVLPGLADFCFFDLLLPDKTIRRVAWSHVQGHHQEQFDKIFQFVPTPDMLHNPIIQVLTTGQIHVAPIVDDTWLRLEAVSPNHLEFLRDLQIHSAMIIPLIARGRTIGSLACCVTAISDRYYHSPDIALATELAGRAALAIDNARLYHEAQEELRMRRQAEEERTRLFAREQAALAELDHFFSLSLDLLAVAGFDGTFKKINSAFETILGYSSQEFLSLPITYWLHPDDWERSAQELEHVSKGNTSRFFEQRYRKKDGTYAWIAWNSFPMMEEGLMYAVGRDITEKKNEELQKETFLSMANHELRTPLTALQTYLQLAERRLKKLQSTPNMVSAEGQNIIENLIHHLEGAMHQVSIETRLTNDLLDASRIQSNKLHIEFAECDLVQIVQGVIEDCHVVSPEREIGLEIPACSIAIVADADRIRQVISNYVTNALKYSKETQPIAVGIVTDEQTVRVWVRDNGPGLSREAQEHIWERFYQVQGVKGNPAFNGFGLGLGLHICQTLIKQHGGTVGIESTIGQGSTFWFTLPFRPKSVNVKEYSTTHIGQTAELHSPLAD